MDNKEIIGVLNDLIRINNDRIEGYEKASENIDQTDVMLKTLFYQIAEESRSFRRELTERVESLGGEPARDTTASGKIYRVWMDVKVTFSGNDSRSTLNACEFGEDAAMRAYRQALDESVKAPAGIRQLIEDQMGLLKMSHDLVRKRRDEFEEVER